MSYNAFIVTLQINEIRLDQMCLSEDLNVLLHAASEEEAASN